MENKLTLSSVIDRNKIFNQKALVIWLTGLSGSGKSTIAEMAEKRMLELGYKTVWLDGDKLRTGLCAGLGFSDEDRNENLRRAAEVCSLFAQSGMIVFASFISPLASQRKMIAEIIGNFYLEVYTNSSLQTCENRDVKGLYAKARKGEIPKFTGISAPYEIPEKPNFVIDTESNSANESVAMLLNHILPLIKLGGNE